MYTQINYFKFIAHGFWFQPIKQNFCNILRKSTTQESLGEHFHS